MPSPTQRGASLTPTELVALLDHARAVELVAEGPYWDSAVTVRRRLFGGYEVHRAEHGDGAGAPRSQTSRLDRAGLSSFFTVLCAEGPVRVVGA